MLVLGIGVGGSLMAWLAFALVVLGIIYFAINYRGFRRGLLFTLLGITVLGAVGGVVAYFYNQQEEQRRQAERHAALTLIKPNQVETTDATLSIGTYSEMKATVTNKSAYHLKELALKITVVDCPATGTTVIPKAAGKGDVAQMRQRSEPSNPFDKIDPTARASKDDWSDLGVPVAKCTAIGQYIATEYALNIPSGQKRAFTGYVRLDHLPPLKPNEWSWNYSIVEVVAGRE